MRMFLSAALITAIFASSALADNVANQLAPGKPAGVKEAQNAEGNTLAILGLGALAGIALIAGSHSSHHPGTSVVTTTTTGTSP